jgi:ABC-type uncharacterized transport system substrate-binding protein
MPGEAVTGSLFDLGADYAAIGHQSGEVVADVLDGRSPASIPVENVSLIKLQVNRLALKSLRDQWELPESVVQQARIVVDESGRHVKDAQPVPTDASKERR